MINNLLSETRDAIERSGRLIDEVALVGSRDGEYGATWEEFATLADFSYDNGYGSAQVATDLTVWFTDGSYLERRQYDGSEWWEYVTTRAVPSPAKPLERVLGRYSPSVADLHDPADDFYR